MEYAQTHCQIGIDSTFRDILAGYPPKVQLRVQRIITETLTDVAPQLAIPSVKITRDDLMGVGGAWVPEDGVICYDNGYLVGVASAQRVPILREIKECDLRNLTAHEQFHLRESRFKKRPSWAVSLKAFSEKPELYNPKYYMSEEEFQAAMFAYRYLESKPAGSVMDAIGKRIFNFKEGRKLNSWRYERLALKYGGSLL